MIRRPMPPGDSRRRHRWIAATALLALTCAVPARAQQIALFVNGDPITTYDIEQRSKFTTLSTRKPAPRSEVIEDLINDKLKIQIGKRYKLEVSDQEVDSTFSEMAKRMRLTGDQLTQMLGKSGVDSNTLKDRIRADIAWQQIVRGKFQNSLQIRDKDVDTILEERKKDDKNTSGIEYTLRPILLVVAHGAGEGVVDARKREADGLRARFENCQRGIPFARAMREVAVREPIVKTSGDLAPALREILDKTEVGRLTEPEVTQSGIEMFALCAKKETKIESAAKREVQTELFAERFQANATKYLKELRRAAMIEMREPTDGKTAGANNR